MNTIIKYFSLIAFACAMATPVFAGEEKIVLMLGGKFCEAYLGNVESALATTSGVKSVDLKSMKGHAVVTVYGDKKITADQLAAVVNGVKGDGWHCTGEVMR